MSLFGAINTAISGLTAQSDSFGNISDNVANSQTTGFKRIDTSFTDYLTTSTATQNQPGAVVATPDYVNNVQGSIQQTDNPLALAISGQGFFSVSQPSGVTTNTTVATTFNPQQSYTRDGNFTMNSAGYLVNDAGNYLNAWSVNATTGIVNPTDLVPVRVSQEGFNPIPTSNMALVANLPATPAADTATPANAVTGAAASPVTSQATVYDSFGTAHIVSLNWVQNASSAWTLQIEVPDASATPTTGTAASEDAGSANVTFGSLSGNAVSEGTIGQIAASTTDPGTVTTTGFTADGGPATVSFTTNFGSGNQNITLNLGTYGGVGGVTQFAGTTYDQTGLTQDGVAPGGFSGVSTLVNGDIVASYNNGQTRTIAQIPLATFTAPDALQRTSGQAFSATLASGTPQVTAVGAGAAGTLLTGSIEGSNVDIATEFSNLIVAQQAYSSNAKVITTANQMLQTTLQMLS